MCWAGPILLRSQLAVPVGSCLGLTLGYRIHDFFFLLHVLEPERRSITKVLPLTTRVDARTWHSWCPAHLPKKLVLLRCLSDTSGLCVANWVPFELHMQGQGSCNTMRQGKLEAQCFLACGRHPLSLSPCLAADSNPADPHDPRSRTKHATSCNRPCSSMLAPPAGRSSPALRSPESGM